MQTCDPGTGPGCVETCLQFLRGAVVYLPMPMLQTRLIFGLVLFGVASGSGHAAAQLISNPNFTQPPAKEGYSYPEYFCTDSKGKRVEIGAEACLAIDARRVPARCDISVNSPAWREESGSCPGD